MPLVHNKQQLKRNRGLKVPVLIGEEFGGKPVPSMAFKYVLSTKQVLAVKLAAVSIAFINQENKNESVNPRVMQQNYKIRRYKCHSISHSTNT